MSITKNDLKNVLKKYHNNIKTLLNSKVDKVNGKDLSTNDYTTTEKNYYEECIANWLMHGWLTDEEVLECLTELDKVFK